MAATPTTKTAYYLRAKNKKKLKNLQSLIEIARAAKPTVVDSEIRFTTGDVVRIQHFRKNDDGVFLHLTRYVPGDKAPTLKPKAKSAEDNEDTQEATGGQEFKDGDCFLLASKHDVIFCSHGIGSPKMIKYLSFLFKQSKIKKKKRQFELSPASNIDKLNLLNEHGVKSVLLSSNAFDISLPKKKRKSWISKGFGAVSDEFVALVKKDESIAEQKAREDLIVNIEVRLDGNTKATNDAQEMIEDLAESILDLDDEPVSQFSIVTQKGERINASEIRLQKGFRINKRNRSIDHFKVWEELSKYLEEIELGNLLEQ